jgi:hypothetical protein
MGRPRLSSFNVIGILLLAIGIYGLIPGTKFTFDPGVPPEPGEAFLYIVTGVLMIVNGFFWMKPLQQTTSKEEDKSPGDSETQEKAAVAPASQAAKTGE